MAISVQLLPEEYREKLIRLESDRRYFLPVGTELRPMTDIRSALQEGYTYAFKHHGETEYMQFADRERYRINGPQHVSFGVFAASPASTPYQPRT